jgi:hypothetical protein
MIFARLLIYGVGRHGVEYGKIMMLTLATGQNTKRIKINGILFLQIRAKKFIFPPS